MKMTMMMIGMIGMRNDYLINIPTPKTNGMSHSNDLAPCSMILARTINKVTSAQLLKVLIDIGATATMINHRVLPSGCVPNTLSEPKISQTIEGNFFSKNVVSLDNVVLPEFDKSKMVDGQLAYLFDSDSCYDIILGRDFLHKIGLKINFNHKAMKWLDHMVYLMEAEEHRMEEEVLNLGSFTTKFLEAKYEQVDPIEVMQQQEHLT
jgi:hypothetical protein